MKLVRLTVLTEFSRKHADVCNPLKAWITEVREAQWQTSEDIRKRFVHASFLAENCVIFNLKGKKYRLDVKISYKNQTVLVMRIGTHAEYSKWKF